jgi:hypothetical protein
MEEPSVLDYVKSRLAFWKGPGLRLPAEEQALRQSLPPGVEAPAAETSTQLQPPAGESLVAEQVAAASAIPAGSETLLSFQVQAAPISAPKGEAAATKVRLPWRSLLALVLALLAQFSLAPAPQRAYFGGVILLAAALVLLLWAILRGEWQPAPLPEQSLEIDPATFDPRYLGAGMLVAVFAYLAFSSLLFSYFNLLLLLAALGLVLRAFWMPPRQAANRRLDWRRLPSRAQVTFSLSPTLLFVLAGIALVVFIRVYRLGEVPPEMNSDHAEKILDVQRVLDGWTSVFFPANGGREALQMYLVAAVHKYLGVELGFMALKLVTVTIGILALPFIYLLGKELGGRRIGWLAFLFAGVAYWPNVVSRFGLRLPFYIFFTATTLYFLLRGIRNARRNDFLYAGISLGLSFYGYSADRILPLLVIVAVGLYALHSQAVYRRKHALISTIGLAAVSFVLFLPTLQYMVAEPNSFLYRTLTRMGTMEKPIEGSISQIFLANSGKALAMLSWSDGEIWPISIPGYPALDTVAGALFYLGAMLLFVRYLRNRHWLDLFMLISIPILMLPSILSLAFPAENPNLYRTGGALVPVFLIIAIALDGLMSAFSRGIPAPWGSRIAWVVAILLLAWSARQDYDWVFNKYFENYQRSAWNSSEMGKVAQDFAESFGSADNIWLVGYPHWVDSRLVAAHAGYPGRDFGVLPENLEETLDYQGAKLFILNPQDGAAAEKLSRLYPQGWIKFHKSRVETKDFLIYIVPPQSESETSTQ